jgi:D-hexose-6-phosphate mutarotase
MADLRKTTASTFFAEDGGSVGDDHVVLTSPSGSTTTVHMLGATVTSFVPADGKEVLFVSSEAVFDGVKPIRGGRYTARGER